MVDHLSDSRGRVVDEEIKVVGEPVAEIAARGSDTTGQVEAGVDRGRLA
jgi:hypothetical protein